MSPKQLEKQFAVIETQKGKRSCTCHANTTTLIKARQCAREMVVMEFPELAAKIQKIPLGAMIGGAVFSIPPMGNRKIEIIPEENL